MVNYVAKPSFSLRTLIAISLPLRYNRLFRFRKMSEARIMGIKLDWQVESEQSHVTATEDPGVIRARKLARQRLVMLIVGVAGVLLLLAAVVLWRLKQVDDQYRQDLLDTVQAEVTALRAADFDNFMAIRRSASDAFMADQQQVFDEYQTLKQTHRLELSGTVSDVEIDGLRGRVVVEEVIDGIPYNIVWFYWYYEDSGNNNQIGWRRVPDDLTFWGDKQEIKSEQARVEYRDLDEALAKALLPRLDDWMMRGCAALQCLVQPPMLRVQIVPEVPTVVEWTSDNSWTLRVTSPLVGRARADLPLSPELEETIGRKVADRLVRSVTGDAPLSAYSDTAWQRADLSRWLYGNLGFAATTETGFVESLITLYGPSVPSTLLSAVRSGATLDGTISLLTGVSMPLVAVDQLNAMDWRDFFQWRLVLEAQLLTEPNGRDAFLSLYDLETPDTVGIANSRLQNAMAAPVPQVTGAAITRDAAGQTYAYVDTTRNENGVAVAEQIQWRLIGGTWKRLS